MKNLNILLGSLMLLCIGTRATADDLPVGPWGRFHVDIPKGWTAKRTGNEDPAGYAMRITPDSGAPLVLLASPLPLSSSAPPPKEFRAKSTAGLLARLQPISEEKNLVPKELPSATCPGFFFSITDKTVTTPTPTDFKYATQGYLQCEGAIVSFTLLTNQAASPERDQALEILRSAKYESSNVPVPNKDESVGIRFPGKAWQVLIDLPGFKFEPTQTRPDGSGVRLAGENKKTGMLVTAFLENSSPGLSAVEHREASWKTMNRSAGLTFADVHRSESKGFARLDRIVPEIRGVKIQQKNINVYGVREDIWLDVHLSKTQYTPADDTLFELIVQSIRFAE